MLLWLIPQVQQFPRTHRFGLAERIQRLALDFQDAIVWAGKTAGPERRSCLIQADVHLEQLRLWLRMARDLEIFPVRKYEHAARLVTEVGRLLGAWIKVTTE